MSPSTDNPQDVISFWFGSGRDANSINDQQKSLWWEKNEQTDQLIKDRYSNLVEDVYSGTREDWLQTATGTLASIITLDQFPRNIYRGTARSFAFDHRALEISKILLETGLYQELSLIQRVFAFIPFEHSEDLDDQVTSIQLYKDLLELAPENEKEIFKGFYDFALKHHEIIEEFGRYPHRNEILGRNSTHQELAFLERPGSSF